MKAILIGFGEIGRAVYEVFSPYHEIDIYDNKFGGEPWGEYDIMLVAFPYSSNFVDIVRDYQKECPTKATIIFSTVAIGTTRQIPGAVHSPVEGKHPRLGESIRKMVRCVGGCSDIANKFFGEAEFTLEYFGKPEATEFVKLFSTSLYGVNIEMARYAKAACDRYGINYEVVKNFNSFYNSLYQELGMSQFSRYILDPPEGNIKGHCIVPNSKILDSQFPNLFLKEIYRDKEGQHD